MSLHGPNQTSEVVRQKFWGSYSGGLGCWLSEVREQG